MIGLIRKQAISAKRLRKWATMISLISLAAQYSLDLKMNRRAGIRALSKNPQEQCLFQRIFWCIYSIEKPLAIRIGRCSIIDDDFIDISPHNMYHFSDLISPERDELLYCCEFAKLCSIAAKRIYGAQSPVTDPTSKASIALSLKDMLESWKCSVLKTFSKDGAWQHADLTRMLTLVDGDLDRRRLIDLSLNYYELLFIIHQRCLTSFEKKH
jgi:hypothetical protein